MINRWRVAIGAGMVVSVVIASGAFAASDAQSSDVVEEIDTGDALLIDIEIGAEPSPAGCVGKSNDPHKATTTGGIKGVTQIDCLRSVGRLRTTAQLWRKRWWGYEKVGSKGDNTNYSTWQVKASGNYSTCESNRWRTEGEHWSTENGRTYYAHTMNYNDVSC